MPSTHQTEILQRIPYEGSPKSVPGISPSEDDRYLFKAVENAEVQSSRGIPLVARNLEQNYLVLLKDLSRGKFFLANAAEPMLPAEIRQQLVHRFRHAPKFEVAVVSGSDSPDFMARDILSQLGELTAQRQIKIPSANAAWSLQLDPATAYISVDCKASSELLVYEAFSNRNERALSKNLEQNLEFEKLLIAMQKALSIDKGNPNTGVFTEEELLAFVKGLVRKFNIDLNATDCVKMLQSEDLLYTKNGRFYFPLAKGYYDIETMAKFYEDIHSGTRLLTIDFPNARERELAFAKIVSQISPSVSELTRVYARAALGESGCELLISNGMVGSIDFYQKAKRAGSWFSNVIKPQIDRIILKNSFCVTSR